MSGKFAPFRGGSSSTAESHTNETRGDLPSINSQSNSARDPATHHNSGGSDRNEGNTTENIYERARGAIDVATREEGYSSNTMKKGQSEGNIEQKTKDSPVRKFDLSKFENEDKWESNKSQEVGVRTSSEGINRPMMRNSFSMETSISQKASIMQKESRTAQTDGKNVPKKGHVTSNKETNSLSKDNEASTQRSKERNTSIENFTKTYDESAAQQRSRDTRHRVDISSPTRNDRIVPKMKESLSPEDNKLQSDIRALVNISDPNVFKKLVLKFSYRKSACSKTLLLVFLLKIASSVSVADQTERRIVFDLVKSILDDLSIEDKMTKLAVDVVKKTKQRSLNRFISDYECQDGLENDQGLKDLIKLLR